MLNVPSLRSYARRWLCAQYERELRTSGVLKWPSSLRCRRPRIRKHCDGPSDDESRKCMPLKPGNASHDVLFQSGRLRVFKSKKISLRWSIGKTIGRLRFLLHLGVLHIEVKCSTFDVRKFYLHTLFLSLCQWVLVLDCG
jgi:hypothetical protein